MITWGSHKIATTFEGGQASKSEAKIHSYPKSNPLKSIPSCPNVYFPIFSGPIPLISQILVEILLCLSSSSMMSLLRRAPTQTFSRSVRYRMQTSTSGVASSRMREEKQSLVKVLELRKVKRSMS
jgi:hypothetical protein